LSQNHRALEDACILSVQNGVRAEELLTEAIPKEKIISSIVMFGATHLEPGKVVHNFEGNWIIGRAFGPNDAEVKTIGKVLNNAFPIHVTEKIRGMKWLKLFLNLNNCLPALLGKSIQETFSSLETAKISMRLWREALEVVNRAGIKLESLPDFPLDRLIGLASMPLDEAGKLYSSIMTGLSEEPLYGSILQSIKRARPSEIDYINGEITRLGEKIGVPASLNSKVVEMVHRLEKTGKFLDKETVLSELGGENG
jgi:2-dehydropantoate 2-reductase